MLVFPDAKWTPPSPFSTLMYKAFVHPSATTMDTQPHMRKLDGVPKPIAAMQNHRSFDLALPQPAVTRRHENRNVRVYGQVRRR